MDHRLRLEGNLIPENCQSCLKAFYFNQVGFELTNLRHTKLFVRRLKIHNFVTMVKLTTELIQNSFQYINPVRDRELDLRGYKIPMIENLGATLNQFDTIDFTDNDIRKLDNFPLLPRLKCLFLSNNRIVRINPVITEAIPNLESLVLTNNLIAELSDIDSLTGFKKLTALSLLFNPVSTKEHYRLYIIHKLPQLRLLDFRKIKLAEREQAKSLFKTKVGKQLRKAAELEAGKIAEELKTMDDEPGSRKQGFQARTDEQVRMVQHAIANANSLEEIERLNAILRSGQLPPELTGETGDGNGSDGVSQMEFE